MSDSRAQALHMTLDEGWQVVGSAALAFGQTLARSSARAVRNSVNGNPELPWAVLGEVPLDEENSACGCTTIVFGGVRMQVRVPHLSPTEEHLIFLP